SSAPPVTAFMITGPLVIVWMRTSNPFFLNEPSDCAYVATKSVSVGMMPRLMTASTATAVRGRATAAAAVPATKVDRFMPSPQNDNRLHQLSPYRRLAPPASTLVSFSLERPI